jgi:hypothetical protein
MNNSVPEAISPEFMSSLWTAIFVDGSNGDAISMKYPEPEIAAKASRLYGVKDMNTEQTAQQSLPISLEKLLAFVRAMISGNNVREDDDYPLPPGPWDPVIRIALERMKVFGPGPEPWGSFSPVVPWRTIESAFGPQPEPWKVIFASILTKHPEIWDAISGGHSFGDVVSLNPQPLPPRYAFFVSVAQAVISRAELFQAIADVAPREGEQRGIILVSGYIARFIDEFCGTGFRLKYPFPGPRPNWFANELDGIDLALIATQFKQAAKETFSSDLRQNLTDASTKLVEAALSKMQ